MATKRMFDKSIIETDSFSDLPMTAKAIYFLLGMEADDEGFVSPKRIIKIYGGSDDDIKVLIAKNFIIPFKSGVVVITDWNNNNWLDNRRVKPTRYTDEKSLLCVNEDKKYELLSKRLASAKLEEYRGEEKRIEENRVEQNNKNTFFIKNKNSDSFVDKSFKTRADASKWVLKNYSPSDEDYFALEIVEK